jgi:hypothetical protein
MARLSYRFDGGSYEFHKEQSTNSKICDRVNDRGFPVLGAGVADVAGDATGAKHRKAAVIDAVAYL